MSQKAGQLYIVATPIGNQSDFSPRAIEVLQGVDKIAAEDTRHSARLLKEFAISTHCVALHEHNERQYADKLIEEILRGKNIALISDAGTPLVSDPGYWLVNRAHQQQIKVVPVPGPCALIAALSASGLSASRFCFEGFIPVKKGQRQHFFEQRQTEPRTLIFYEAPHRIQESLTDMRTVFGPERIIVLARELTKKFETIKRTTIGQLAEWVTADENQQKGEIVLLLEGFTRTDTEMLSQEHERILRLLLAELPLKQAVKLAVEICGEKKKKMYNFALQIK